MLDSFKREFGLDGKPSHEQDAISANLVSLFQGGSFFGAAFEKHFHFGVHLYSRTSRFQLPVSQSLGRKWTINLSNVLFIASALMQVGFFFGPLLRFSVCFRFFLQDRSLL